MSQLRHISDKVKGIGKTKKITKAMELVASGKMKKAQDRMKRSRPYTEEIGRVLQHVAASHSESRHPYLETRSVHHRVAYVVVTSDRGLCGGLNVNLLRLLIRSIQEAERNGMRTELALLGDKGERFFRAVGGHVLAVRGHLGENPQLEDVIGVIKVILDAFKARTVDAVYLASNVFVHTLSQKPIIRQLLPLQKEHSLVDQGYWDYIYEPDASYDILEALLKRYIESQIYHAVLENIACEQSARMVAMKNATENAEHLIQELQLMYNKARQASITREISEIIGGAEAVE